MGSIQCFLFISMFQSTPPRRRRLIPRYTCVTVVLFQSTPPRRRRLIELEVKSGKIEFQSTPPRRRRPNIDIAGSLEPVVSIHASAQEATF